MKRQLALYQEAIFNDQLEWWSPERKSMNKQIRLIWSQYDPDTLQSINLMMTIQNILVSPRMPTTASCFLTLCKGMNQMQERFTRLWNKNLTMTHTVVPMLKWQPPFGRHINPRTKCMMAAQRQSNTQQSTLRF